MTTGGDLLVTGAGELVTNASWRSVAPVLTDAAVAVVDGRVAWTGHRGDVPRRHRDLRPLDVGGRAVVPGFVDAHTHAVFAGDRAGEFADRLRGVPYEEVLASGGGIHATVAATRERDLLALVADSRPRLQRMLEAGTTTAEVKSGYGLDAAAERRQLEAVAILHEELPLDLVPTFLGAHALPPGRDRGDFLREVISEMLPACAALCRYCDVFCDRGAFTVEEARTVLEAGRRHGLRPRIHAEELARTGGAQLAVDVGAASADHLVHVSDEDVAALAGSDTVAVLLPATSFSLRSRYAPARALWDAGATVALATDCNPGTSYVESMPLVVAFGCLELGLTPEESLWAATRGGALALEREDVGRLTEGDLADLVVLDAPSYLHLPYRPGSDLVWAVVKRGEVVAGGT